jgi:hypothetical protein
MCLWGLFKDITNTFEKRLKKKRKICRNDLLAIGIRTSASRIRVRRVAHARGLY